MTHFGKTTKYEIVDVNHDLEDNEEIVSNKWINHGKEGYIISKPTNIDCRIKKLAIKGVTFSNVSIVSCGPMALRKWHHS